MLTSSTLHELNTTRFCLSWVPAAMGIMSWVPAAMRTMRATWQWVLNETLCDEIKLVFVSVDTSVLTLFLSNLCLAFSSSAHWIDWFLSVLSTNCQSCLCSLCWLVSPVYQSSVMSSLSVLTCQSCLPIVSPVYQLSVMSLLSVLTCYSCLPIVSHVFALCVDLLVLSTNRQSCLRSLCWLVSPVYESSVMSSLSVLTCQSCLRILSHVFALSVDLWVLSKIGRASCRGRV